MIVDAFQHWMYTHPNHTVEQRTIEFKRLQAEYSTGNVDWTGYEHYLETAWHKQLHIYEVPFYYIEYAMAQLGAIAVFRNYRENPELAIIKYKEALSLGYQKPIKDIYETAGVKFDFSKKYIHELAAFVEEELKTV